MKPTEIQELIKFVAKSGVSEVEIENKDFKITIKTPPHIKGKLAEKQTIIQTQVPVVAQQPVAQPIQNTTAQPIAQPIKETPTAESKTNENKYITIKSPMIGTFYRKPAPDKPNFVSIGDDVSNNSVVCIIEAMKLFNEIEAELEGKIVKILVDDGSPVEYDQPLFLVDPA